MDEKTVLRNYESMYWDAVEKTLTAIEAMKAFDEAMSKIEFGNWKNFPYGAEAVYEGSGIKTDIFRRSEMLETGTEIYVVRVFFDRDCQLLKEEWQTLPSVLQEKVLCREAFPKNLAEGQVKIRCGVAKFGKKKKRYNYPITFLVPFEDLRFVSIDEQEQVAGGIGSHA